MFIHPVPRVATQFGQSYSPNDCERLACVYEQEAEKVGNYLNALHAKGLPYDRELEQMLNYTGTAFSLRHPVKPLKYWPDFLGKPIAVRGQLFSKVISKTTARLKEWASQQPYRPL